MVGGHPTPDSLPNLLKSADAAGVDIIEIGFPFSDPIADGPVIAAAMHEALQTRSPPARFWKASVRSGPTSTPAWWPCCRYPSPDRLGRASFLIGPSRRDSMASFFLILIRKRHQRSPICATSVALPWALVGPATTGSRLTGILESCRGFVLVGPGWDHRRKRHRPEVEARVAELRKFDPRRLPAGSASALRTKWRPSPSMLMPRSWAPRWSDAQNALRSSLLPRAHSYKN